MRALLLGYLSLLVVACAQPGAGESGAPGRQRIEAATGGARPPAALVRPSLPVVSVDDTRALGADDARVAVVEFADYQCPYCRVFHATLLPKLREAYIDTGKVRYFYLDLPLRQHRQAFAASVAARCAGQQGKFWPMHERLYVNQATLNQAPFVKLATELELDVMRFRACMGSQDAHRAVQRDMLEARRAGVTATPTVVLGRIEGNRVTVERMAPGTPAFEEMAREIEALLAKPGS